MQVRVKRVYETAADSDGYRVLVDRLWPRGMQKEALEIDEWCKDVAPSSALRTWFGHRSARFVEFRAQYLGELEANLDTVDALFERAENNDMTLVYAARDPECNHAVVLASFIEAQLA